MRIQSSFAAQAPSPNLPQNGAIWKSIGDLQMKVQVCPYFGNPPVHKKPTNGFTFRWRTQPFLRILQNLTTRNIAVKGLFLFPISSKTLKNPSGCSSSKSLAWGRKISRGIYFLSFPAARFPRGNRFLYYSCRPRLAALHPGDCPWWALQDSSSSLLTEIETFLQLKFSNSL